MKKRLAFTLIIILLFSFVACNNSTTNEINKDFESNDDIVYPSDKVIIGTMEIDPFMYFENGEMVGPNIDIVSTALDNIGYEYEFMILPWSRLLVSAKSGDIDMAYALYDSPERREYLHYIQEPIGLEELSIFVPTGSNITFDGNLSQLSEYRIGIVQDYFYTEQFHNAINSGLLITDKTTSTENNIEKLLNDRVDLIIENEALVKHYLKTRGLENQLEALEVPLSFNYSYITFSKVNLNDDLRQKLNLELKDMKADGSFYKIFNNHGMDYYSESFKARELINPPPEIKP